MQVWVHDLHPDFVGLLLDQAAPLFEPVPDRRHDVEPTHEVLSTISLFLRVPVIRARI